MYEKQTKPGTLVLKQQSPPAIAVLVELDNKPIVKNEVRIKNFFIIFRFKIVRE
jgi:hypothetical protein